MPGGLGLVGAMGARGASEELQSILKQRFLDAIKLREQEAEEQKIAEDQRRYAAGQPLRDATLEHINAQTYALKNPKVTPTEVNFTHQDRILVNAAGQPILGPDGKPQRVTANYDRTAGRWQNQQGDPIFVGPDTDDPTAKSGQPQKFRVKDPSSPSGYRDVLGSYDPGSMKYKDQAGNVVDAEMIVEPDKPDALSQYQKINTLIRMQNDWDRDSADYNTIRRTATQMQTSLRAIKSGDKTLIGPGAEAIRVLFQKIVDPPSVVREGEFYRELLTQSFYDRARGFVQKFGQPGGDIPVDLLPGYVKMAELFLEATNRDLDKKRKRVASTAAKAGWTAEDVMGEPDDPISSPLNVTDTGGGGAPVAPPTKRTGLGAIFAPTGADAPLPGDPKRGDFVGPPGSQPPGAAATAATGATEAPVTTVDLSGTVIIRTPSGLMKAVPADQARGQTVAPPPAAGMTRMRTPSGQVKDVPAQIPHPETGQMVDAVKYFQDVLKAVVIARGR